MVKRSRQRDAIMNQLAGRKDHPTAETLYAELKTEIPNLSLATVYRNLNQLVEWGEIKRFSTDGAMRYDPNTTTHSHFFCTECGCVQDVMHDNDEMLRIGRANFDGIITSCTSNYYGLCYDCMRKNHTIADTDNKSVN